MLEIIAIAVTFLIGSVSLVAYQRHLVVKGTAALALAILTALNDVLIDGLTDKDNA